MKQLKQKWIGLGLIVTLLVTLAPLVQATDFSGHEDEYYSLCNSEDLSKDDIKVCKEFQTYLKGQQKTLDNKIKENESKISNLNMELKEQYELIDAIKADIAEQQAKIDVLAADIARLEASIQKRDQQIRDRMYVMQSYVNSDFYLQFLMGASSLEDLYGRMASLDELTSYDRDLITKLNAEKEEVELRKQEEEEERERLATLEAQQEALANQIQQNIQALVEANKEIEDESAFMASEMDKMTESVNAAIEKWREIEGPETFGGFICPVSWGVVTSSGYTYDDGTPHYGMDIAGRFNSNIYAVGDGMIIYYSTGCASDGGYLGNTCGGGAGNWAIQLTRIDGMMYAVRYLHMINDNYVGWSSGNVVEVSQGQVIGHMGTSGSSTGTHVHLDVLKLGDIDYNQALRMAGQTGLLFGIYSTYSNYCINRGAPCRMQVRDIYGYSLYQQVGNGLE